MKASRAAVRQVKALEKIASRMDQLNKKLDFLIEHLQKLEVLPELPPEPQESTEVPEEDENLKDSFEVENEEVEEASGSTEPEADSDESAVRPTEEEVELPFKKVSG